MEISGIQPSLIKQINELSNTQKTVGTTNQSDSTGQAFNDILNSLTQSQEGSDSLTQQLSMGGNVNIDQVLMANQENDINMRVAMAMRDELVNAYREVMRMAV